MQRSKRIWKQTPIQPTFGKSIKSDTMYTHRAKLLKSTSIIILIFISIVITFDSGLFIYPSLSNSLLFSILTSLLTLLTGIYATCKTNSRQLSTFGCIISLWGVYIMLHCYCNGGEYYRSLYLISGILYLITLSYLIRAQIISSTVIKNILLCMAIAQLIFMTGQSLNIINSYSKYFPITGTNENPNVNAIFLLCCIPILIERIKTANKMFIYKIILGGIILFLFVLQCRTAYIGGIVILTTYLFSSKHFRQFWQKSNYIRRFISLSLLCATILFAGIYFYQIKKNSADGRLLIWKLSTKMIAENPIQGYGYGLFERNYNLKQASYFSSQTASTTERRNASFVAMAYNDYLEQTIEGGIMGLLFYLGFFILLGSLAIRQRNTEALSIVLAIAAMALFNFIYAAITTWFLLLSYGAILLTASDKQLKVGITPQRVLSFIFCCVACLLLYYQSKVVYAQTGLKRSVSLIKRGQIQEADNLLAHRLEHASTSEAFLTQYANLLVKQKRYEEAILFYQKASLYTSNISLYYRMADCHARLSQYSDALRSLKTIAEIIPTNLRSRYQIMNLQRHIQDIEGARETAREIISISPKVPNKKADQYKEQAKKILEFTNQQIQ